MNSFLKYLVFSLVIFLFFLGVENAITCPFNGGFVCDNNILYECVRTGQNTFIINELEDCNSVSLYPLSCSENAKACVCPQGSNTPTCDGNYVKYCAYNDLSTYIKGEWLKSGCSLGESCINGQCVCNDGAKKCDETVPELVVVCTGGQWIPQPCPDNTFCVSALGARCVECYSSSGDYSYCYDVQTIASCTNYKLSMSPCPIGSKCLMVNEDQATCQPTQNNPPAVNICSTENAMRCNGDTIEKCINGQWTGQLSCAPGTCVCSDQFNCVCSGQVTNPPADTNQNQQPQQPQSGSSGSSGSSSGGSYSGGGEVTKKCYTWSDWFINKTDEKFDPKNPSIVCTNTTYIRWCIRNDGTLDYSISEKKYDYKCGQKVESNEICNYKLSSQSSYTDYLAGQCRSCVKETYVYTCSPSGKTDYNNQKVSSSCGLWRECTPEEKAKFEPKQQNQPPAQSNELLANINKLFQESGWLILALFILLLLVGGAIIFWKFFKEGESKPPENAEGE
jgi:uncharacterized membrane protein YgcG